MAAAPALALSGSRFLRPKLSRLFNEVAQVRRRTASKFFTGAGCATCGNSGYKGRKGIYELLDITDPLRELITQKAPTLVLRQKGAGRLVSKCRLTLQRARRHAFKVLTGFAL